MMRNLLTAVLAFTLTPMMMPAAHAAALKTKNVVVVTLDGARWQEVFTGAEAALMTSEIGKVIDPDALKKQYDRPTPEARRLALMPFLWTKIAKHGQILGNRNKRSTVALVNGFNSSYAGYNELFTGAADPRISYNTFGPNPNPTVFEWLSRLKQYRGKVAAFGGWQTFRDIFNRDKASFLVRAGRESLNLPSTTAGTLTERQKLLEDLIVATPPVIYEEIFDSFLFYSALEHLREHRPRVLFIGLGETDEWAHKGNYEFTLHALHQADRQIQQLWELLQSLPGYRNQTTLIVTTDHGRGSGPELWKTHGTPESADSKYTWLAALGPDTPARGEVSDSAPIQSAQVASTIAAFLGKAYVGGTKPAAPPIRELLGASAQQ